MLNDVVASWVSELPIKESSLAETCAAFVNARSPVPLKLTFCASNCPPLMLADDETARFQSSALAESAMSCESMKLSVETSRLTLPDAAGPLVLATVVSQVAESIEKLVAATLTSPSPATISQSGSTETLR